jgi:hypothetical protein
VVSIEFGQNERDRCRVPPLRRIVAIGGWLQTSPRISLVSVTPLLLGDASKQGIGGSECAPFTVDFTALALTN